MILASLGAILFAAKAIVVKFSYQYGATADVVLTLRMVFSLPIFWLAVWWNQRATSPQPLLRRDVTKVCAIGLLGYFLSSYLDFLGLHYISAGLERVILYLTPAIVLVLSKFFLKKEIDRRQYSAMAVAYLGIMMVFMHDIELNNQSAVVLGSILVFLAAVVYSIYLIFAGELVGRVGSIRLVALASASATVATCIQSLVLGADQLFVQQPEVYYFALINALFCTFMPMLFIMMAVNRIGSSLTAQAGTIGPVGTAFLGWYFLSEPVSALQLAGIAVVLIGIAILLSIGNKPNQNTAPTPTE
ncbi:DMT family transporter [Polynucleobacter acidiphobus]|uniref:DMT family transporter n=1 Tax=Polynucleobacter acidiphobus TaxID=556053 RepID=UPI000D3CAFD4|nr:DMT family transporter [Polynucleobacter acidiphobus]